MTLDLKQIFEDLVNMGISISYIEDVNKVIVLKNTHTTEEIDKIKQYLAQNNLKFEIVNPVPLKNEDKA